MSGCSRFKRGRPRSLPFFQPWPFDQWWARPSRAATAIVAIWSSIAFGLTTWYLWSGLLYTLVSLTAAVVLLRLPLASRWPLTPRRATISALAWFGVGIPGGYFFGTAIVFASVLMALSLAISSVCGCLWRGWPPARQT